MQELKDGDTYLGKYPKLEKPTMTTDHLINKCSFKLFQIYKNNRKSSLQCFLLFRDKQQDPGFSLIEVVAVVLMIGVLAAIAAPSWLTFINRQRLNKANDVVVTALQQASREAKKTKTRYSVTFKVKDKISKIAVHPSSPIPGDDSSLWQPLGQDVDIKSGQVALLTNLTDTNKTDDNGTLKKEYNYLSTPKSITFDYMGSLPEANFGKEDINTKEIPGLKIAVVIPNSVTSASDADIKRCVIFKTLLGAMVIEKDNKCN